MGGPYSLLHFFSSCGYYVVPTLPPDTSARSADSMPPTKTTEPRGMAPVPERLLSQRSVHETAQRRIRYRAVKKRGRCCFCFAVVCQRGNNHLRLQRSGPERLFSHASDLTNEEVAPPPIKSSTGTGTGAAAPPISPVPPAPPKTHRRSRHPSGPLSGTAKTCRRTQQIERHLHRYNSPPTRAGAGRTCT